MSGRCAICRHPQQEAITVSTMRNGLRPTARTFQVSLPALYRHKRHVPGTMVLNRSILPALNRCAVCGKPKEECQKIGKGKDIAPNHKFERDKILPEWHGWHAARRGLGTNL
jgi:hypothetical protein